MFAKRGGGESSALVIGGWALGRGIRHFGGGDAEADEPGAWVERGLGSEEQQKASLLFGRVRGKNENRVGRIAILG
ncbi:MAG: hypothetical protein ACUVX8_07385, partial [Candidatus Zipacnadales bacterium]